MYGGVDPQFPLHGFAYIGVLNGLDRNCDDDDILERWRFQNDIPRNMWSSDEDWPWAL